MTILALEVAGDASDAAAALDSVGTAVGDMADKVGAASREADRSASGFDAVGESADVMASRSAQAAGGLGDLGGALSLMPGPLGAVGGGMEALAPAIMGVTGASDLLNLVTQSTIVTQTRAKVASIAKATADKAAAAATAVVTAAQWAWNAALAANPIGLVIIAVLALVAGFILLYKKSETFRRIVKTVMTAVKGYVLGAIKVIRSLVGWIADKASAAWRRLRDVAVGVAVAVASFVGRIIDKVRDAVGWVRDRLGDGFRKVRDIAQAVVAAIRDRITGLIDKVRTVASWVRDRLVGAFQAFSDGATRALSPVTDLIGWLVDKIDWVIDKLGSLPGLGALGKTLGGVVGRGVTSTTPVEVKGSTTTQTIVIQGAIDPVSTANQVGRVLGGQARRLGAAQVVTPYG